MAPEQVEGKDADARTDIFAFGAVLFEMLTGRKAFTGQSQASLTAAILEREPLRLTSVLPQAPLFLEHVLNRCLAKNPDDRWQSARDVRLELESLGDLARPSPGSVPLPVQSRVRDWLGWALAAGLLVAVFMLLWGRSAGTPQEPRAARFSILPPEHTTFLGGYAAPHLAMSPDGRRLAFVPTPIGGRTLLWIRALDSLTARPLAGTDGASFPFWSPDGRSIAFFADGKLKTIDSDGGAPHVICDAPDTRGGAWSREGVIVFAPQIDAPLYRVQASGGQPIAASVLDTSRQEVSHRLPSFLPDGRQFLFFAQSGKPDNNAVYVGSLDSKDVRRLAMFESKAVFAAGFLLFSRDQALMAQRFDPSQLQLVGAPVSLSNQVAFRSSVAGDAVFSVADNGTLAYWDGGQSTTTLTWFDRQGTSLGTLGTPGDHYSLALSPDERKVATEVVDAATQIGDIWLIDVTSGIRSRFTFGPGWNWGPLWSPDGGRLVFGSIRGSLESIPEAGDRQREGRTSAEVAGLFRPHRLVVRRRAHRHSEHHEIQRRHVAAHG